MKRSTSAREGSVSPPPTKRRVDSNITGKAVATFFTPVSKKEPNRLTWRVINNSLLMGSYAPRPGKPPFKRQKIAAFDFDSTLIKTASGNVFSKDAKDWTWWDPKVPSTLKKVYEDGYATVILTNQGKLSLKNDSKTVKSDQKSLATFKTKVESILSHFEFPITLLAATARDQYRKPRIGMWNELLDELDLNVGDGPNLSDSFFVGDAAGRPARDHTKADHSCSDRNFADNVGIHFKTPEEHFLGKEPEPYIRGFVPSEYLKPNLEDAPNAIPSPITKKNNLDVILLCGSPAAGKSTFYWTYLRPLGYERINQDLLKTRDRCVKVAFDFLSEGQSVTIDNTNADIATRAIWIDLASKIKVPIRCVFFTASPRLCEHNDTIRALTIGAFNPEKRSLLPHSAFAGFAARFKEPSEREGFQDLTRIDFQFRGTLDESRLWGQYWT